MREEAAKRIAAAAEAEKRAAENQANGDPQPAPPLAAANGEQDPDALAVEDIEHSFAVGDGSLV